MGDLSQQIAAQIAAARARETRLAIVGGNSKPFIGRAPSGESLDLSGHTGIVSYAPSELVITARGATTLAEIESTLGEHGQMLGFEPPRFGPSATIAGTLACNLSGPRRPWAGSARDAVLGVKLITGRAAILRFGGQVMKNVAGFDVSRLQAGALGVFGVIAEVSLRVLPEPAASETLVREMPAAAAIAAMNELARRPAPLTGAAWVAGKLYLRLEGAESAVRHTATQWGGRRLADAARFWLELNEQRLPFFEARPLWRLAVRPTAELPTLPNAQWLIDWAGGQRFVHGIEDRAALEAIARSAGGHLSLARGGDRRGEVFQPLPPALAALHERLKLAFDPDRVLNPGRLYSWL